MYTPVRGYDGMVSQGVTPTPMISINDWTANVKVEIQKQGPFLNDAGKIYRVRGAIDLTGTFKGTVPAGLDVNETAIITALTGGTDINLVLRQGVVGAGTTGYVITVPTAVISDLKLGQDGKNGATFEGAFEASGTWTIA